MWLVKYLAIVLLFIIEAITWVYAAPETLAPSSRLKEIIGAAKKVASQHNLLLKPEAVQKKFEQLTGNQANEFLNFIGSNYPEAKVIKFGDYNLVRIPSELYPHLAVYLVPENLRRRYVIGFHATSNIRVKSIVVNGLKGNVSEKRKVFFHVGLDERNNSGHGSYYGQVSTRSDVAYILNELFESPKRREASQHNEVLESELTRLENAINGGVFYNFDARKTAFVTQDLAQRYGAQLVEVLIPRENIVYDHDSNIENDIGVVGLYELAPEYILHVSEKMPMGSWWLILPVSTQQLLATCHTLPDPFDIMRAAVKAEASL